MKKIVIVVGVVLVFAVAGMIFLINKLDRDVQTILEEQVVEVVLDGVSDGVYKGEYKEALATNAEVEVSVKGEKIIKIQILKHSNGQGEDAEAIIEDIIREQSVLVDDVSGATYSSRVIKLAVKDAVNGDASEED